MKKKKKVNNDSSDDEADRRTDSIISSSGTLDKPQVYSGRKTNNSLSSLAFSLSPASAVVPEPTEAPPPSAQPSKKKVKTSHVVLQTDEDLRTGMYKVLEHLRNHADAWAFLDPVEESIAPNYYAVIRRPMHITKLEDRLDKGYYASLAMFDADFKLMMDNCKLYNGPESEYTHMAYTLEKVFAKLRAKYLETDMSSDEEIYIDMSYQQNSSSKKRRRSTNSDEKENNKGFKAPGKRGRKKKVGRKPKEHKLSEGESPKNAEIPVKKKVLATTANKKVAQAVAKSKLKESKLEKKEKLKKKSKKCSDFDFDSKKDEFKDPPLEDPAEVEGPEITDVPMLATSSIPVIHPDDEEDDDDDDDYDEPPLLVREDPYPEDDDEEFDSSKNNSLDLRYSPTKKLESKLDVNESAIKPLIPKRKPGRPRKDANTKAAVITQVYNTNRDTTHSDASKRAAVTVCKYTDDDRLKLNSPVLEAPRVELLHDEADVDEGVREDRVHEDVLASPQDVLKQKRHAHRDEVSALPLVDEEDDDDDDIEQDVCIYYKNDDYQSSEEEKEDEAKAKKDYINRRHSELFGEIDDLDEEENNDRDTSRDYSDHHSQKSSKHSSKKREKDRKKHKHSDKHHHHHHHHHHKSKSKDGKHHHKKKDKKHSSDKENSRKVLKVEEVYDCSEEDPNSRDIAASPAEVTFDDEGVLDVPEEGDLYDANFSKEDEAGRVSVDVGSSESETSILKKKRNKHKSKHHSKHHSKHKDGKSKDKESKNKMKLVKLKGSKSSEEKTKTPKLKTKENKKISKSSKNGKKKLSEKNVAAIDALSVATEQTLKDITFMLDAPGVARLSQDEELRETLAEEEEEEEEEDVYQRAESERQGTVLQLTADALRIEQEYRQRLKMDKVERQKCGEADAVITKPAQHKKKKRKKDGEADVNTNDGESKKKKLKTEHEEDDRNKKKVKVKSSKVKSDSSDKNDSSKVKSDNCVVKSDTELENKKVKPFLDKKSDSDKELDNGKELFKDIKDGRIKPGAIIKSKDIAKKEGVVKKEPKPPAEAKPKPKPNNPFGKINKQENSKLTTLIAKAKESRVGLVPNSEVGDSPKLSLGSIIVSGDIGTGIKSTHETDDDDKWEPTREREKWESSPWEGSNWDRPSEREENTPVREEEPVKSEREEMEEVVVCDKQQTPSSNESREDKTPTIEEIALPVTPRAPEIKQERATPNLSAWFKAFGAPKNSSSNSNNQNSGGSSQHGKQGDDDDDVDITELHSQEYPSDGSNFSRPESRQSRQTTPVHHQQQLQQRPSSQLQIHQSPGAGSLTDHLNSSMEQDQDDLDSTNSQQLLIGSCSGSMRDPMSSASRASSADRNHRAESNSDSAVDVVEVVGDDSNDSVHSGDHFNQPMLPSSPKPVGSPEPPLSPEPPMSPEPPLSPEKPPETPWYDKLDEKMEDEPIWRKNKMEEEEDPYKFEEEELDRAREEAKKLEVERQRKASVSSSGVSDRSPVPSLDNSPAAFSEGERSPAINSPVTPGFGGKQYSPVTEKSPNIPSYSPRYDANINKPYSSSYDADKSKYQANGGLKVGFYKDHSEKSMIDKQDGKSSEHKPTESPLYSPTVPYVSNFYSKSDSSHNKQKSPGRYNSFYPPSIDPSVDKPKTPGYYPSSAPSTPSDKPSPNTMGSDGDKSKTPFNYYNYDPNKPLTDQFKGSGSSQSTPTHSSTPSRSTPSHSCDVGPPIPSNDMNSVNHNALPSHAQQSKHVSTATLNQGLVDSSRQMKQPSYFGAPDNNSDLSPSGPSPGSASLGLTSPNQMSIPSLPHHHQQQQQPSVPAPPPVQEKPLDLPPPKKRPGLDRVIDESNIHNRSLSMRSPIDISLFSQHSSPNLPANLANLSQIVSRFPEPQGGGFALPDKDSMSLNLHHERHAPSCPPVNHDKILHSPPVYGSTESSALLGISDLHTSSLLPGRRSQMDLPKGRELELQHPDRPASLAYHHQVTSPLMPPAQSPLGSSSSSSLHKHQSQTHGYNLSSSQSAAQPPPPPAAHQKSLDSERPGSRSVPPPPPNVEKSHHYLPPKTMWTSSSLASTLPVSLSSSLASSFNSAAMAQFALAGQKGLGSLPPERLAQQLGMDRAALASLASRSNANIFPHELLGRSSSHQSQSQMGGGSSHSSSSGGSSSSHGNNGSGSTGGSSSRSTSASNSVNTASNSNMDLTLARSYASLMTGGQSSPLFGRGDGTLTPRTLPGSTSPFLSQSPGLSSSLSMPGAPRTPTPAHQQPHQSLSLGQSNFGSSLPRDPISQSHPSLQIPSMNSIVSSQPQISHLNAAAGLASYHGRDSFSLMGQSSRGALVGAAGGLVDPATSQQLYQQYLQRQQEEFLLRSSHPQLAAQHSMMLQQGFMSAAGYPSGYPASLGLRSGSYQGMNRPWL